MSVSIQKKRKNLKINRNARIDLISGLTLLLFFLFCLYENSIGYYNHRELCLYLIGFFVVDNVLISWLGGVSYLQSFYNKSRTLSPWIYEELSFMRYLPIQQTILRTKIFSSGMENLFEGVQLKMAHEADMKGFLPMDKMDLSLLAHYGETKGLDALYHRYSYKPSSGGIALTDY